MPARGKDFGGGATLDSPRAGGDKKVMQVYVSKGGQHFSSKFGKCREAYLVVISKQVIQ